MGADNKQTCQSKRLTIMSIGLKGGESVRENKDLLKDGLISSEPGVRQIIR